MRPFRPHFLLEHTLEPNPGLNIKDQKRRGEWAEIRFMARVAEHGLVATKPWGDSSYYDFIVEWQGCVLRVQVKSTLRRRSNSYYFTLRGAIHRYTKEDFDFIAAYVIPADMWYLVPADVALININQMCITPGSKTSRYEPYREAWDLLKERRCAGNPCEADLCFRRGCKGRQCQPPAPNGA